MRQIAGLLQGRPSLRGGLRPLQADCAILIAPQSRSEMRLRRNAALRNRRQRAPPRNDGLPVKGLGSSPAPNNVGRFFWDTNPLLAEKGAISWPLHKPSPDPGEEG